MLLFGISQSPFRFHRLVQQVLRQWLSRSRAAPLCALHAQAGRWYCCSPSPSGLALLEIVSAQAESLSEPCAIDFWSDTASLRVAQHLSRKIIVPCTHGLSPLSAKYRASKRGSGGGGLEGGNMLPLHHPQFCAAVAFIRYPKGKGRLLVG